jgi:hypothetical protein
MAKKAATLTGYDEDIGTCSICNQPASFSYESDQHLKLACHFHAAQFLANVLATTLATDEFIEATASQHGR